jgi:UDP-N-acetylglucosamine 2-epimerase (non-hydrolysing)
VGTDRATIVDAVAQLLQDAATYDRMARAGSPYGDGQAARRIVGVLKDNLRSV